LKIEERKSIEVPKTHQIALEVLGVWDLAKLLWKLPEYKNHPSGQGDPILVLPGYATDDNITLPLRQYLKYRNFQAEGWGLGYNHGEVPILVQDFEKSLLNHYRSVQKKITLIGWSLGGYVAREVARDHQDIIDKVITIASPVFGGAKYTSIADYYSKRHGIDLDELEETIEQRFEIPLQVPMLSIYSKWDNIVSWQTCIDQRSPRIEHFEVEATHIGMILNPEVFLRIAQFLTQ